jgi:hypothetical protein
MITAVSFLFAFYYILHTAINNSLFKNVADKPVLVVFEDDPQWITFGDPSYLSTGMCRIATVRSTTDRLYDSGPIILGRVHPFIGHEGP